MPLCINPNSNLLRKRMLYAAAIQWWWDSGLSLRYPYVKNNNKATSIVICSRCVKLHEPRFRSVKKDVWHSMGSPHPNGRMSLCAKDYDNHLINAFDTFHYYSILSMACLVHRVPSNASICAIQWIAAIVLHRQHFAYIVWYESRTLKCLFFVAPWKPFLLHYFRSPSLLSHAAPGILWLSVSGRLSLLSRECAVVPITLSTVNTQIIRYSIQRHGRLSQTSIRTTPCERALCE